MSDEKSIENGSKWALLGLLRFSLASMVMFSHYYVLIKPSQWFLIYFSGSSAVLGFLVLSGYSIAASLERNPNHYYRRRLLRIYPLYIVCLFMGVFIRCICPHEIRWPLGYIMPIASIKYLLISFFMLQTIAAPAVGVIGPTWSLAVEWWHYMVAPKLAKRSGIFLVASASISLIAFLSIQGSGAPDLQNGLELLTLSCFWVTGFLYYRYKGSVKGLAILVFPYIFASQIGHTIGLPFFISVAVLCMCEEINLHSRVLKIFNFLGDLSYPLYLFHVPLMVIMMTLHHKNIVVIASISIIYSIICLYLIDYPLRKARLMFKTLKT